MTLSYPSTADKSARVRAPLLGAVRSQVILEDFKRLPRTILLPSNL